MTRTRPNIIFIVVDELRYPVHFPEGVTSVEEFVARFMPNTYRLLWSKGVTLDHYFTAASDCTPARGTIVTGLYSQQTYCMATRANPMNAQATGAPQPALDPAFPTYGKLLREAGYDTPYVGKWHLSSFPASAESSAAPWYLREYGFEGLTFPDPLGLMGQGIGATLPDLPPVGSTPPVSDVEIANAAVSWLQARANLAETRPFCLTIGFVNPHDKQWFWGAINASQYNQLYQDAGVTPPVAYTFDIVRQMYPAKLGYGRPDNWQAGAITGEPGLHTVFRETTDCMVGGVANDASQTSFTMAPSPIAAFGQKAVAPFSYWGQSLDMYTQAMTDLDQQIGQVVQNIPASLLKDTVVVFTSDHGEYSSSHGMQGKGMSVYQECMRVPFCFTDFTGRYASSPGTRTQMGSSVDLLPLFANLAFGDASWKSLPAYQGMYDHRNDLLAVVRDPDAQVARNYCLYAADEPIPVEMNYLKAPEHVVGYVDATQKLGLYSFWNQGSCAPLPLKQQTEYFDYVTDPRQLELDSHPDSPAAQTLREQVLSRDLPAELHAPLPEAYQAAQAKALAAYWKYVEEADLGMALVALMR